LLATLTASGLIGSVASGNLDFSEGTFSQNAATHVNGTPTWFRIRRADTNHVVDGTFGAGQDGVFTGVVVTGTPVTFNPSTITAPNA
jgi:hypothetical protein